DEVRLRISKLRGRRIRGQQPLSSLRNARAKRWRSAPQSKLRSAFSFLFLRYLQNSSYLRRGKIISLPFSRRITQLSCPNLSEKFSRSKPQRKSRKTLNPHAVSPRRPAYVRCSTWLGRRKPVLHEVIIGSKK